MVFAFADYMGQLLVVFAFADYMGQLLVVFAFADYMGQQVANLVVVGACPVHVHAFGLETSCRRLSQSGLP